MSIPAGSRPTVRSRAGGTTARDRTVGLDPAGMLIPCAHLSERARGRGCLAVKVQTPARDSAVGPKSATVVAPRAHLRDCARGEQDELRLRLAPGVGKVGLAGDRKDEAQCRHVL